MKSSLVYLVIGSLGFSAAVRAMAADSRDALVLRQTGDTGPPGTVRPHRVSTPLAEFPAGPVPPATGSREWSAGSGGNSLPVLRHAMGGFTAACESDGGLRIRAVHAPQSAAQVCFRLSGIGYGDALSPAGPPVWTESGPGGLTAARPGVMEWYRHTAAGLEHGFTLEERPATDSANAPLTIRIGVESSLRLVSMGPDAISFRNGEDAEIWSYRHLSVTDATGRRLPAWMKVPDSGSAILLCMAEGNAAYPLTVDPLFSSSGIGQFPALPPPGGSDPQEPPVYMARVGDYILHFENDGTYGDELWRTSTVTGITEMVSDVFPGSQGCRATGLTEYKGSGWFSATDAANHAQLWRTDGTTAGTGLFIDLAPLGITLVRYPVVAGDFLYFEAAGTGSANGGLWRTDGTVAGTARFLPDFYPGLTNAAVLNGHIIAPASGTGTGEEVWVIGDTPESSMLLKDINPGTGSSMPRGLTVAGGHVFFQPLSSGELWQTDGTPEGTVLTSGASVSEMVSGPLAASGDSIFFIRAGTSGSSLWTSNGTQTTKVRTLTSNPDVVVKMLGAAGGLAYFSYTVTSEVALWKTDGTSAGTSRLISLGTAGTAAMDHAIAVGDMLFFQGTTQAAGDELWKTDGTAAGTAMVKDVYPGPISGGMVPRLVSEGILYFRPIEPVAGRELWRTDGTSGGTTLVHDVYPSGKRYLPAQMTVAGDSLFFTAYGPDTGRELWKTSGTPETTLLVKDTVPGGESGFSDTSGEQFISVSGLLFGIPRPLAARSLLRSDGTAEGTFTVKSPVTGPQLSGSATHYGVPFGDLLLLPEGNAANGGLWRSDGTVDGTFRLATGGEFIVPSGPTCLFTTRDDNAEREVWKTDGTLAGTVPLYPGTLKAGAISRTPYHGRVYFSGNDGVRGFEPWSTDGTAAGTTLLKDLTSGTTASAPTFPGVAGDRLILSSEGTSGNQHLWASDGTAAGTVRIATNFPRTTTLAQQRSGTGPFVYLHVTAKSELWRTDGTAAGTIRLHAFNGGAQGAAISDLWEINGRAVFSVFIAGSGTEIWGTDGTAAGTVLLPAAVLAPTILGVVRGRLYFSAVDATHGNELWVTDGTAKRTALVEDLRPGFESSSPLWLGEVNGKLLAMYASWPDSGQWALRELHVTPVPELSSGAADRILTDGARLTGHVDPDGATGTLYFEYGGTTGYGAQSAPVLDPAAGPVSVQLAGLTPGTDYHFRMVFDTGTSVSDGEDQTFRTGVLQAFAGPDTTSPEITNGQAGAVSFPATPDGVGISSAITLRNAGSAPVNLTGLAVPATYTAEAIAFPASLAAGASVTLTITQFSAVPGEFGGTLTVSSDTGDFAFPVTTTVFFVNDPPVVTALPVQYTPEDTALTGQLSATDPDNQPLSFLLAGTAEHGTASVLGNGQFTFTPALDFHGTASFPVKANDGSLDSAPVIVSVEVLSVIDPPVLDLVEPLTTPEDTALHAALTARSVEPGTVVYHIFTPPDPGTGVVVLESDGGFTFTPAADYSGVASFIAEATVGTAVSNRVLVVISVTAVNDPPVLSAFADRTAVAGLPLPGIAFTLTDPDSPAALLRISAVSSDPVLLPASHLQFSGTGNDRTLSLTPPDWFAGVVSISVSAEDEAANHTVQQFTLTILENITGIAWLPTGAPRVHFTGVPGQTYSIDRSPDAGAWTPRQSVLAPATGEILWTDPAPVTGRAFYRLSRTELQPGG